MIPLIDTMRTHDAVYWGPERDTFGRLLVDKYAQPIFKTPAEIKVYWLQSSEQFVNAKNEQRVSRSIVFTGVDVEEQGLLFQGTIANVPGAFLATPHKFSKAYEIQRFDKISTLENDQYLRRAWL